MYIAGNVIESAGIQMEEEVVGGAPFDLEIGKQYGKLQSPKTDISPEKWYLRVETLLSFRPIMAYFQGRAVTFREGI